MITYDYFQNLSLEQVNELASQGWEVSGISILEQASSSSFNVFVKKGFQEKTLVESGDKHFWVDETMTYGEGMILTFLTFSFFIFLAVLVFKFIFRK